MTEEMTREEIAAATKAVMAIPCNNPSVMSLRQGTVGTTLCRELVEKIVNTVLTAASQSRPAADRGQIVEECARVAERFGVGWLKDGVPAYGGTDIATAIRALSPAPAQTEDKS